MATDNECSEPGDVYWFRSGSNRAEAEFKSGYTLGDVKERAGAYAREWAVSTDSVTYGLVSTAVE
jgi:hypothetical protein